MLEEVSSLFTRKKGILQGALRYLLRGLFSEFFSSIEYLKNGKEGFYLIFFVKMTSEKKKNILRLEKPGSGCHMSNFVSFCQFLYTFVYSAVRITN